MPEGEHSWERKKDTRAVAGRVSSETGLLLEVAAMQFGVSLSALVADVLERWARDWLRTNATSLRAAVQAEKEARAEVGS